MKQHFVDHRFQADAQGIIDQANDILDDYQAQGYTMTLRQLYYQFVSKNLFANIEKNYSKLSRVLTRGREAGLVDWDAIEDGNRGVRSFGYCESEYGAMSGLEYGIVFDRWERQDQYVEVWVEKDALSGVIRRPCQNLYVPYMACKGYMSASEAWRAGQRFAKALENGKECILFHLGDHDPSGMHMTVDNEKRTNLFSSYAQADGVEVRRLALNMDQVDQYDPPPNPAKFSDPRASGYVAEFGSTSWELDALEPSVIEALITDAVKPLIDQDRWDEVEEEEGEKRKILVKCRENWDGVKDFLNDLED